MKVVPSGRAGRHDAASSVGPIEHRYRAALRPCLALAHRTRTTSRHSETNSKQALRAPPPRGRPRPSGRRTGGRRRRGRATPFAARGSPSLTYAAIRWRGLQDAAKMRGPQSEPAPLENQGCRSSNVASRKFRAICSASNASAAFALSKFRKQMPSDFMGRMRSGKMSGSACSTRLATTAQAGTRKMDAGRAGAAIRSHRPHSFF